MKKKRLIPLQSWIAILFAILIVVLVQGIYLTLILKKTLSLDMKQATRF